MVNDGDHEKELTKVGFIKFAAQSLNSYSGDPLALAAFVNNINVCKHVGDKKYDSVLKDIILTKLEEKAYECIDPEDDIDNIVDSLREHFKPDNSKAAFKLNKLTSQDYAQKAEELAEALKRSLDVEGITRDKANEMAIEKTVEMCRQSAKSDLVRSVIASTSFNDPKEVIAKLIN